MPMLWSGSALRTVPTVLRSAAEGLQARHVTIIGRAAAAAARAPAAAVRHDALPRDPGLLTIGNW